MNDGDFLTTKDTKSTKVEHPVDAVFVDGLFTAVSRIPQVREVAAEFDHQWCHMWSDDLDALHAMAARIGMRREWFQDKPGFPHYDLLPPGREKAIATGAVARSLSEYLREKRRGFFNHEDTKTRREEKVFKTAGEFLRDHFRVG